jgi:hypothetical protein
MDLVDEQDVAFLEGRKDRGQVARSFDGRTRCVADVDPELARDDRREGRLAEPRRPVEEDVVGGLSPALRRLEQHRQVRLDLGLADVFAQRLGSERALDDRVDVLVELGGQDLHARGVVDHRARS